MHKQLANADRYFFDPHTRIGRDEYLSMLFKLYPKKWELGLRPFPKMPLWMVIDHYWDHACQTYAQLPHVIQALEHNLGHALLRNPGEWFVLGCAAYLHDAGMSCTAADVAVFANVALGRVQSLEQDLISGHAQDYVHKHHPDGLLHPSSIRKLHADIGAWRIVASDAPLMPFEGEWSRLVAKVVSLHRRGSDRDGVRPATATTYPFSNDSAAPTSYGPIRIGLLASLVALSDGCLLGSNWVSDPDALQAKAKEVRHEIRQLQTEGTLQQDDKLLQLLLAQDEHFLMHRSVGSVTFLPDKVLVEPADYDPKWLQRKPPSLLKDVSDWSHQDLITKAIKMIKEELDDCRTCLQQDLHKDILPHDVVQVESEEQKRSLLQALKPTNIPPEIGEVVRTKYDRTVLRREVDEYAQLCLKSYVGELPLLVRREDLALAWPNRAFEILYLRHNVTVHVDGSGRQELTVQLDGSEWGVYNNKGKSFMLKQKIQGDIEAEAYDISEDLHRMLTQRKKARDFVDVSRYPLRWSSGGFIPFARLQDRLYCALFFRDISPIGWNVANGASERQREYRNPGIHLMKREFGEELMIVDQLAVDEEDQQTVVRQKIPMLNGMYPPWDDESIWQQYSDLHRTLRAEQDGFEVGINSSTGFSYHYLSQAPGRVIVEDPNVTKPEMLIPSENVVFSINPTELGIEVIWPIEFTLDEDDRLLDGEILEDRKSLVRRPIALISVEFLRDVWERTGGLGSVDRRPCFAECKMLPEVPPDQYVLYDDDIRLRKRLIQRAGDDEPWAEQNQKVLAMARKWLEDYEHMFLDLQQGKVITHEQLRMLCPVTWKTLEILFAHECLPL